MIPIRILICDDHNLFRSGLVSMLRDEPGIYVVGEAFDGNDLIKKYEILKPDVVLVDISMPGISGTDTVKSLKAKFPHIKVLFLTMHTAEQYIYVANKVGGMGLVNKSVEMGELVFAIMQINSGKRYFGPRNDEEKIDRIMKKYENIPVILEMNIDDQISEEESELLILLSDGLTSEQIGEVMNLSKKTVDLYRGKIKEKFNLPNSASLMKFAVKYAQSKSD